MTPSMPSPQWEKLKEIFHQAVALPGGERSAYLDLACTGDALLRQAANSLLQAHEETGFMDNPAFAAAAELIIAGEAEGSDPSGLDLKAGETVGRYRVLSLLGKGGMGQVYLAEDTRLHRKVSLKFLSAEAIADQEHILRFEQEARAASALNHPNIVTIHEIVEADGLLSIVAEYIDGETLREKLEAGPVTIIEALNIAEQIASALAAAHAEGIVHRDIKPENIMLRRDGIVKILDFGVAKVAERAEGETTSGDHLHDSIGGPVRGTITYMSPEQVHGLEVDARTDIWSLGSIIYEMLAGHRAFAGTSKADVIASIVHGEPRRLSVGSAKTPDEIGRIIKKALKKDRNQRYHNVSELLGDLRDLKQRLQFELELRRTQPNTLTSTPDTGPLYGTDPADGIGGLLRSKAAKLALTALLALIIAAIGIGLGLIRRKQSQITAPPWFDRLKFTSLTNSGRIKDAAISRDGRHVAYVEESTSGESIFIRQLANATGVQIVAPNDTEKYGLTFSNDGDHLHYVVKQRNNSIGVLHRVPAAGGVASQVLIDVDGPISFSPDGRELTFVRGSSTGERALMIAAVDGTRERVLARRRGTQPFSYGGPAWSPDSTRIACGAGDNDASGRFTTVVTVDLKSGEVTPMTSQRWGAIGRLIWLPDGSGVIFTATDLAARSSSQLWYVSYPGGQAKRVSNDLADYNSVSLTNNSTALVTMRTQTISSIWVTPDGSAARAKQISSSTYDGYSGLYTRFAWTLDNRIVYTAMSGGSPAIFTMNSDGGLQKQLTADAGRKTLPSLSPDGRFIVYVSDKTGLPQIWRMDSDGSNQVQLTDGIDDSWPQFTADGQSVIFQRSIEGQRTLWKVAVNGGDATQITNQPSVCPMLSPDGQWVACYYRPEAKSPWKLAIIPITGGEPQKLFDIPSTLTLLSLVRWTPDAKALAYIDNREGVSNIWELPLDGTKSQALTDFKTDRIFWFGWSPDGKQLGLTRGLVTSDVVLIETQH